MILRIGNSAHIFKDFPFIPVNDKANVLAAIKKQKPKLLVIEDVHLNLIKAIGSKIPFITYSDTVNIYIIKTSIVSGSKGFLLESELDDKIDAAASAVLSGDIYLDPEIGREVIGLIFKQGRITYASLTKRENEMYSMSQQDFSAKEISEILSITLKSVRNALSTVNRKLSKVI